MNDRSALPGTDSLFGRFLVVQLATVLAVALMLGLLFYVDRNLTLARLIGERWSPALLAAAGQVEARHPTPADPPKVLRSSHLPEAATLVPTLVPRNAVLRDTLRAHGLAVERLALQQGTQGPILWIELAPPQSEPVWLGLNDPLIESAFPLRVLIAVGLGSLMVVVVSWRVARWLTRPLNELRERMAMHRPGQQAFAPAHPGLTPGSSTEVRAMESAWNDIVRRLERHERERALMLAGMSHDLRSPLSRIRLAAALLPDVPGVAERRNSIERNVGVADRLIQSVMDHARTAALPLDQPVDMRALARQVVMAQADAQHPVSLLLPDANAALVLPQAHPVLLECMLTNLLDNAWIHGKPPVCLSMALSGSALWIDVRDGGSGIAPEHQEAVLQAFYRADPSRSQPGAGLGLAIVKEGLDRLGGRIEFSRPNGCHQVRLVLPLESRSSASSTQ